MKLTEYRVDDLMRLVRRQVDVREGEIYHEIGLRSFGNGVFHKPPVTGEELGGKKVFHVKPGDLLFSSVFAWEGAVALASEQESGRIGSHRFMTYEVDTTRANPRYLLHYFYGGPGLQVIRESSPGSAGRNRTLGIKNFERQIVRVPGRDEQCRIASKLDAAMSQIAQFANLRAHSSQLARQYTDSLLRPIVDRAPLSVGLRQSRNMVDVEPESRYAITGIYSFGRGLIKRPTILGSDTAYVRLARLHAGQVVMSKLNAWEGALAVVGDAFDETYVSPEYPSFDINDTDVDPSYIEHLLGWPGLWSSLTPRGSMVRRKRTTPATLLATEVPLPSLTEQRRIARQLTMVREATDAGAEQTAQVAALRPALLNAAFSGQL
ncbi:hypothetical protein GCM10010400_31330 [Streptomyces aculeolatus]|uniref:restriction endonuclease subunit S n=1 Tax=Streptomyces aculeolatus TaxID=270689 RepID=UPI001CEDC0E1|nr:hypothetical protein [Streptomyces aculeolatus]